MTDPINSLSFRSPFSKRMLYILVFVLMLTLALAAAAPRVQAASNNAPVPVLQENQNNVPASMPVYYIRMHSAPNDVTTVPSNVDDYVARYILMHTPGLPVYASH